MSTRRVLAAAKCPRWQPPPVTSYTSSNVGKRCVAQNSTCVIVKWLVERVVPGRAAIRVPAVTRRSATGRGLACRARACRRRRRRLPAGVLVRPRPPVWLPRPQASSRNPRRTPALIADKVRRATRFTPCQQRSPPRTCTPLYRPAHSPTPPTSCRRRATTNLATRATASVSNTPGRRQRARTASR